MNIANDDKAKKTILYKVNSNNNSKKHLGWLIFKCETKIVKTPYGSMDGVIEINTHFIYNDSLRYPRLNQFFGSVSYSPDLTSRASISKSTARGGFGGIYLEPSDLNGHRIGGLVMDTIVNWLKQFDGNTTVNGIKYHPAKEKVDIVNAFYKKFSIPLSGETTIANLTTNDSWKKNIFEYDIENIFFEVWQSKSKIKFYEVQNHFFDKLNKKIEKESQTWKSIIFGNSEHDIDNYCDFVPLNKNLEYYENLQELKSFDNIKIIINLFIEYNQNSRKLHTLMSENEKIKNKIYQSNKINAKPLKFKYGFHKLFLNKVTLFLVFFLAIVVSNRDFIISFYNNFIINK